MAATDTEARKELISHFGPAVADHPDVMSECEQIPRLMTPVEIADSRLINAPFIQPRPISSILQV